MLTRISRKAGKIKFINNEFYFVLMKVCSNAWKIAEVEVWRQYYLTDHNSLLVWETLGKIHHIYRGKRHKHRLDRWEGVCKFGGGLARSCFLCLSKQDLCTNKNPCDQAQSCTSPDIGPSDLWNCSTTARTAAGSRAPACSRRIANNPRLREASNVLTGTSRSSWENKHSQWSKYKLSQLSK